MKFSGAPDARLVARSLKEGWPMTPANKREAISFLEEFLSDSSIRPTIRSQIERALGSVGRTPPSVN